MNGKHGIIRRGLVCLAVLAIGLTGSAASADGTASDGDWDNGCVVKDWPSSRSGEHVRDPGQCRDLDKTVDGGNGGKSGLVVSADKDGNVKKR